MISTSILIKRSDLIKNVKKKRIKFFEQEINNLFIKFLNQKYKSDKSSYYAHEIYFDELSDKYIITIYQSEFNFLTSSFIQILKQQYHFNPDVLRKRCITTPFIVKGG